MLPAFLPGHPLQKHTDVQWDIGAALGADHGADESTSPQAGIIPPQMHLRARLCPRDYPGGQNSLVLHDDRVGNGERRRPPYDCC
jgi:hypothetical protein